jgi:folate-binding protein YgfZ
MQSPAPFLDDDQMFEVGDGLEQRGCDRTRCERQACVRIAIDQVTKKTGRQYGIADARRGYKQDIHLTDARALYRAPLGLPSRRHPPKSNALHNNHAAIMTEARFVLLDDRGILAVGGPDRRAFLQGLVSNDVGKVSAAQARYAALLTAQGKYLHDFTMIEQDKAILLDGEAARLSDLKRRLLIYRLRAKVTITERPDLAVAAIFGPDALAALDLPPEPGAARAFGGGVAFVDPRLVALGVRCVLPRENARLALAEAGFTEIGFDAYDGLRLGLGIADSSRDLAIEKSILLEAGFDELNGVDWNKGCYIGQELTARTKYRGLIKRRLMPVTISGPQPSPGMVICADGREVGEMRSSRDGRGLALLRIDAALDNRTLTAGEAVVHPEQPDWMRLSEVDKPI